ncbi:MAG: hypothetical protein HC836_31080 [Richelia sp. RM2_1_2]|nr:hypothetical protein [Richelia sp. RM2_1_2]
MPTNRPRISVQLESEALKLACEKYIEDEKIKSMSTLVNYLLVEFMEKKKYYETGLSPKLLK